MSTVLDTNMSHAISDAANLTLIDNTTGTVVLYTPYANKTSIEFTSEQVYAHAKGVRAVRFDHGKSGKLDCEFEVFELKFISVLLGGSWTPGKVDIATREFFTVDTTPAIVLGADPKDKSLALFKLKADEIAHEMELVLDTADEGVAEGKYKISGKNITLNATTCPKGTLIAAYYMKDSLVTAERLAIKADEYPVSYTVIGDTMMKQKHTGVNEYIQFQCNNSKPLGQLTFTLEAGGVTNIVATFDLFGDASNNLMTITKL